MKAARILMLLAVPAVMSAEPIDLTPGRVLERVPCRTPGHSYALYLPAAYSPQRRWPLMVCFDPGGNGAAPVRRFQEAAEARGWIVVGSNNSRNGPWQPSLEAARVLWSELGSLAVDGRRVYTSGFSGGAQMAMLQATAPDCRLAGVLACSNDLPDGMSPEELHAATAYFTTAGLYDFNYWPVMRLNDRLHGRGLTVECEVFAGPHAWPPSDLLARILEWFDVQAMRNGSLPRDDGMVNRVRERLESAIRQLEGEGRLAEALDGWERLSVAWRGLGGSAQAEERIRALQESPEQRKSRKARSARQRDETEQVRRLMQRWVGLLNPGEETQSLAQRIASLGIDNLQRIAEKKSGTPEGDGARRRLGLLASQALSRAYDSLNAGRREEALLGFETAVEIRPGDPVLLYNLACVQARTGDRKRALKRLEQAIDAGFRDADQLATDEDLKALRGDPAFTRLAERVQAQAREKQP